MDKFDCHWMRVWLVCLLLGLLGITIAKDEATKSASRFPRQRSVPEIWKTPDIVHYDRNRFRAVKSEVSNRKTRISVRPLQEPSRSSNSNNSNVMAQTGTTAFLNCNVGDEDVTIVWVKRFPNSTHVWLLTINDTTVTDDKRFSTRPNEKGDIWTLRIKYTRTSDQGLYECQVCNHPTFSIYVNLSLVEAFAEILDDEKTVRVGNNMTKTIDKGFPIRLSCILHNSIQEPDYIFWYFQGKVINYELKDTASVRQGRLGSELIFRRAEEQNQGTYTCIPSNAKPASITVKVNYLKEVLTKNQPNAANKYEGMIHIHKIGVLILFLFEISKQTVY